MCFSRTNTLVLALTDRSIRQAESHDAMHYLALHHFSAQTPPQANQWLTTNLDTESARHCSSSVKLIPLGLAQLDPIPYIHRRPPSREDRTDESSLRAVSRQTATALYRQAGSVPGLHPRLYPGERPSTRTRRH